MTTLREKQPVYFTPCLPHRFLPVHWDQTMIIVCQSLGSRPILVLELLTVVPHLFGTNSHSLSVQPFQLLLLRNIWRHISLTWPFPHRYRHSPWPVDVTKLFPRFCCWTLICLSRHRAWLHRGYWYYRTLIDWCNGLLYRVCCWTPMKMYHWARNIGAMELWLIDCFTNIQLNTFIIIMCHL